MRTPHVEELLSRGVKASEITAFDERDGGTFFGFADPDGNTWAVQQIKARARPLIPPEWRSRFGKRASVSIEVWPATAGRFDDVATMLGPKNPDSRCAGA